MLDEMQKDPAAMMNPANWLEINRMVWEKVMAFSQGYLAAAPGMNKLANGQHSNGAKFMQDSLKVQQEALRPIQRVVAGNAKRLG